MTTVKMECPKDYQCCNCGLSLLLVQGCNCGLSVLLVQGCNWPVRAPGSILMDMQR